jgi:hypothetical protein
MRTHLVLAALAAAFLPARSWAGASISEELGLSTSPSAGSQPRAGAVTNALSGSVELSDAWALRLGVNLSLTTPSRSDIAPELKPSSSTSISLLPAIDWDPNEHISMELGFSLSPRSTIQADSSVSLTILGVPRDFAALISSVSSSYGASFWLGYDTAGDSDFETGAAVSLGAMHYATKQKIEKIVSRTGNVLSDATVLEYCRTLRCSQQRKALLGPHPDSLDQLSLGGSLAETFWKDTDLALAFTYYLYDEDPTQVGYFNLTTAGASGVSFGTGLPLAPPQWMLRPDLVHRFGSFQLGLWYRHTQYVTGEGAGDLVGVKAQYKFSKAFRLWASVSFERDRDAEGTLIPTNAAAAGVKVRW